MHAQNYSTSTFSCISVVLHYVNVLTVPSCAVQYLAERRQVTTEGIEVIIQTYFPEDFEERKKIYEEELSDLAR